MTNIVESAYNRFYQAPAREVIGHAAAVLDRVKPDWYKLVDLDRLDLTDWTNCLLGQVYGPSAQQAAHRLNSTYQVDLGAWNLRPLIGRGGWALLVDEIVVLWTIEIENRRKTTPTRPTVESLEDVSAEIAARLGRDLADEVERTTMALIGTL